MKQERNSNIEILRLVLMVFILLWHVILYGYGFLDAVKENSVYSGDLTMTAIFMSIFVPAVYCFVFISGYFGICFKLSKFIQLVFWCFIVGVGALFIQKYCFGKNVGIKTIRAALLPLTSERWWFMSSYIKLYILSPLINFGLEKMDKKQLKVLLFLMFLTTFLYIFYMNYCAGNNLYGLIFMYILGYYFKRYYVLDMKTSIKWYAASYLTFVGILLMIVYTLSNYNIPCVERIIMVFCSYINPLAICMSVSMFYIVYNLPKFSSNLINKILSYNLFIYLMTESHGGGDLCYDSRWFRNKYFLWSIPYICHCGLLFISGYDNRLCSPIYNMSNHKIYQ